MIDCGPTCHHRWRAACRAGRAARLRPAVRSWPGGSRPGTSSRRMSLGVAAEPRVGLDAHLVGPAELVEVVDVGRAEVRLERAEDVVQLHAHPLGLLAVDVQVDLRHAGPERGGDPPAIDLRQFRGFRDDRPGPAPGGRPARRPRGPRPASGSRRRARGPGSTAGRGRAMNASRIWPSSPRIRATSASCCSSGVVRYFQSFQADEARSRRSGRPCRRAARTRRGRTSSRRPGVSRRTVFSRSLQFARAVQRGRVGQLDRDDDVALVLLGQEAGRGLLIPPRRNNRDAEEDEEHQPPHAQEVPDGPARSRARSARRPR